MMDSSVEYKIRFLFGFFFFLFEQHIKEYTQDKLSQGKEEDGINTTVWAS